MDFFEVTVDKNTKSLSSIKKLSITELDGFTPRNSLTAAVLKNKVVFFGGQDSE